MVDAALSLKIIGLCVVEALGIIGGFLPFLPKMR